MAYPPGTVLCTCAVGASRFMVGGEPVAVDVLVTPLVLGTGRLTWSADGSSLSLSSRGYSGEPGEAVTFQVPAVDQDGIVDGSGNAFTMWSYRVQWHERGSNITRSVVFQPLSSQAGGVIDVDLLPDGTVGTPGSSPVPAVTSVVGKTGAVSVDDLAAALQPDLSTSYAAAEPSGPYTAITPGALQHVSGAGAFAALHGFLSAQTGSAAIHIASDSTGVGDTFWPYLLAQWLADQYPDMGVRYYAWDFDNDVAGADPGGVNARFAAPVEIQAPANGYRKVSLPGTAYRYLSVPAATYGDLTGDLDVAVKASQASWPPAATSTLAARMGGAGDYGWLFYVDTSGKLNFRWSADGNTVTTITSSAAVDTAGGTPIWMRATLDVDNGAGGYTVTFYTSDTGADADWTQLGEATSTTSGTTSIHHPADVDYALGAYTPNASGSTRWVGDIYEVYLRDGIYGPTLTPTQVQEWMPAADGLDLYSGGPVIDIIDAAWGTKGIDWFTDADRLKLMTPMWPTSLVIFNDSHNDGDARGAVYLAKWDTWRAGIADRLPLARFAVTGQNPRVAPASSIDEHAIRHVQLAGWAAKNGATFLDVYSAFQDDSRWTGDNTSVLIEASTGVHPTDLGMTDCWLPVVQRAILTGS